MTKKSKVYLAVIAGSLLFAAGSLAWQSMQAPLPPAQEEEYQQETQAEEEILPPMDLPRGWVKPQTAQAGAAPEDTAEFEGRMQAYFSTPVLQAFSDEISAAAGDISPGDFETGAVYEKYFNNPQIQKILLKYSSDPAFLEMMRQMVADEAFIKGAAQAAGTPPDTKKRGN